LSKDTVENDLEQRIIQTIKEKRPETISQLITLIKEERTLTDQQILKHIQRLQEKGKIHLRPASPAQTLTAYVRSTHAAWYWITLAITAATIAAVYTIPPGVYPQAYLRNVVALIFTLWLPGYTFIKALFPQKISNKTTDKDLDTIERIALSVGMSLALVPIVGLLLNYTPWGINLIPSTLSLAALTLAFATAAILREHQTRTNASIGAQTS
jgi:hypothetical protein